MSLESEKERLKAELAEHLRQKEQAAYFLASHLEDKLVNNGQTFEEMQGEAHWSDVYDAADEKVRKLLDL